MRKDRLIVGILCIAFAVWTYIAGNNGQTIAPATAIAILGIISIAIARKK
jgi:hypothetical protein